MTAVTEPGLGRALLIAVGPEARRAADTDPRSAGRRAVGAADWRAAGELVASAGPGASALVALPAAELTYRALEGLLASSVAGRTPLGVLPVGPDGRLLGARSTPAPPAPAVGALYCHFRDRFECQTEYGRDEAEGFLRRVAGGVEAAVVHAHGNGADLQFGPHVLCVQVDHLRGTPPPGQLVLPCQAGGPCRLSHLPLTAYWGASAIRARILVLASCWGYHPADGLLGPEALLGTALFRGPSVEAFVASTRVTYNTPDLASAALAFLELGGTAGQLALLLNRFPGTATPPYVCVGDPDVTVRMAGERHPCGVGAAVRAVADPDGVALDGLVALAGRARRAGLPAGEVLAAFGPVLKEGRPGRVSAATRDRLVGLPAGPNDRLPVEWRFRALTALAARHTGDLPAAEADGFWDLVHAGPTDTEVDERWCALQARLLRRRGPDQLGYLSAVSHYRDERREPEPGRHQCGNRLYRITVVFDALAGHRRDLCFCERCGLLADVPAGWPAPVLVAAGPAVRVAGGPWPRAWLTAGPLPVGPELHDASSPREQSLADPIPVPAGAAGRRLGVALVAGGDHVIIQTLLPAFPAAPREA